MHPAIQIRNRTYHHFSTMVPAPAFAGRVQDRSFVSPKRRIRLRHMRGAYMDVGGKNILLVVSDDAAPPGSGEWQFVRDVAQSLKEAFAALDPRARKALGVLHAVVFAKSPKRSFANVSNGSFFYDTDEFAIDANHRISTAYAASNIVHDANHVLLHRERQPHAGEAAEIACWRLQVANKVALGLSPHVVHHLGVHPRSCERPAEDGVGHMKCRCLPTPGRCPSSRCDAIVTYRDAAPV